MKNKLLATFLTSALLLAGCAVGNGGYSSLEDITSVDISHIISLRISESFYTSFEWQYQYDDYSFLNTKYEKVNFSIKNNLMDKQRSEGGDAICLKFITDIILEICPPQNYSIYMYLSYADYHLYYGSTIEGGTEAYRSKNKISNKYISMLKDQGNKIDNNNIFKS